MSDKHPNPHHQQAPVHDSEEAQPGLDSLAPDDRGGPTPKPTAPGAEPTAQAA
jgi:catalase